MSADFGKRSAAAAAAAVSAAPARVGSPEFAGCLSNGRYCVWINARGSGGSMWGDLALTRWRADALSSGEGLSLFLRDLESGAAWTPFGVVGERDGGSPQVRREAGRLAVSHASSGIESRLEIAVVSDQACELRRLELRNRSDRPRRIEVTTFCEVALLPPAADLSHPAFSRLFVETEFRREVGALLARRRPRASGESWPVMVHALSGPGVLEFESDRVRFIGRGFDRSSPRALEGGEPLSGTAGRVLDPALCLRRSFMLAPGGETVLTALLGAAPNRDAAVAMARGFATPEGVHAAFERARELEAGRRRDQGVDLEEAARLEALASALRFGAVRPHPVAADERDLPDAAERLAALGLEWGAVRVVADRRRAAGGRGVPPALERAARYWRSLGIAIECCVLARGPIAQPPASGGLRVLDAGALEPADTEALLRTASLVISGEEWPAPRWEPAAGESAEARGGSSGAASERLAGPARPPAGAAKRPNDMDARSSPVDAEALRHFNGYGGFNAEGDEYVIRIACDARRRAHLPPRPWVNVIANQHFGFLFSETGAGCTWSLNSREHRITPWANDPLLDPHDEALYLRDDETGEFWSPLPGPIPAAAAYEVRHGFGYSVCRCDSAWLEQETWAFVPVHDPIKVMRVKLRNRSTRTRRISLFGLQTLVLGESRWGSARSIETRLDSIRGAMLARNRVAGDFAGRVAFASLDVHGAAAQVHYGGDRAAFLGLAGSVRAPRALALEALDGGFGVGGDSAFAEQARFELGPGQEAEAVLLLGEGEHLDDALALLARYRDPGAADRALADVRHFWSGLLGTIQIETPVPALDLMVNGWLLYQTVSCRLWGRTALYQSGGAYGFRDQLQDSLALTAARPDWTRAQLLLHAAHQFVEGDVLHWWHPPADRGLRTRVVDDLLWLPYGTAHYVRTTGDWAVLSEMAPYLKGRALEPGENEAFFKPEPAQQFRDLYEHCCHAIDRSLALGAHGLPLFGTGDWNDGMNEVGRQGRGESVWMAFFLYAVLNDFIPLCRSRSDEARALRYCEHQQRLGAAIEREAWDGEWYRRGWYDDGTALGTRSADECQIDALVQAWATLSKAAPRARAERALRSVDERLVSERARLVRLLAPPFDRTPHDPGYIKGYVPGVRENGGQYTHAALWVARAMAEGGRAERAAELLEWMSPATRAAAREGADVYQVEPYVIAADIYTEPPHVGLGGWTWYTGSAGWMYRTVIESLLGITLEGGDTLVIEPRCPAGWGECRVRFHPPSGRTQLEISIRRAPGKDSSLAAAALDGLPLAIEHGRVRVAIPQDALAHEVELLFG